jgi:hypothetical protein
MLIVLITNLYQSAVRRVNVSFKREYPTLYCDVQVICVSGFTVIYAGYPLDSV